MNKCKVRGCSREYKAKGYCRKHYDHLRLYGKILTRTTYDSNRIMIRGKYALIELYNRSCKPIAFVIIDKENIEKCKKYKWCLTSGGYVGTHIRGKYLHLYTYITGYKRTDHKDGNKLNNRRSNLRECTQQQNSYNQKSPAGGSSRFKGVAWFTDRKKWMAYINYKKKRYYLGLFINEIDAVKTYNKAAKKYHGEFARLNKISKKIKI